MERKTTRQGPFIRIQNEDGALTHIRDSAIVSIESSVEVESVIYTTDKRRHDSELPPDILARLVWPGSITDQ